MPFSIQNFTADANGQVVELDWMYSNADGNLRNSHQLQLPAGNVDVSSLTEDVLVGWLEEQLTATVEQFDAAIANAKAQVEYQSGFQQYSINQDQTYSVVVPEPAPEAQTQESSGDEVAPV